MFSACITYVHIVSTALHAADTKKPRKWRLKTLIGSVIAYWVLANTGVVIYWKCEGAKAYVVTVIIFLLYLAEISAACEGPAQGICSCAQHLAKCKGVHQENKTKLIEYDRIRRLVELKNGFIHSSVREGVRIVMRECSFGEKSDDSNLTYNTMIRSNQIIIVSPSLTDSKCGASCPQVDKTHLF